MTLARSCDKRLNCFAPATSTLLSLCLSVCCLSNPKNADAHNLLGVIFDRRGRTADAEREYRSALRFNPNSISARANLGVLLSRTQRDQEAVKMFEAMLRAAPDHPQATINLGLLYASRKEYERAANLLARANELQPQTFDILFQLGMALYNLKRLDEATNTFAGASALSTNRAEPFYFLGLIAAARDQDETAGELWEESGKATAQLSGSEFHAGRDIAQAQSSRRCSRFLRAGLAPGSISTGLSCATWWHVYAPHPIR